VFHRKTPTVVKRNKTRQAKKLTCDVGAFVDVTESLLVEAEFLIEGVASALLPETKSKG